MASDALGIQQTPFGELRWDGHCWASDPVAAPVFQAALLLRIHPDGCDGSMAPVPADKIEALRAFFSLSAEHAAQIVPHLWRYYCDVRDSVDPKPALVSAPEQILNHVHPRVVGASRGSDGIVYISIEAECDWEPEHGVQLVLQNGVRWVRVSDYSGHLTDGEAFGKPSLDSWMSDPASALPVRSLAEMLSAAA